MVKSPNVYQRDQRGQVQIALFRCQFEMLRFGNFPKVVNPSKKFRSTHHTTNMRVTDAHPTNTNRKDITLNPLTSYHGSDKGLQNWVQPCKHVICQDAGNHSSRLSEKTSQQMRNVELKYAHIDHTNRPMFYKVNRKP